MRCCVTVEASFQMGPRWFLRRGVVILSSSSCRWTLRALRGHSMLGPRNKLDATKPDQLQRLDTQPFEIFCFDWMSWRRPCEEQWGNWLEQGISEAMLLHQGFRPVHRAFRVVATGEVAAAESERPWLEDELLTLFHFTEATGVGSCWSQMSTVHQHGIPKLHHGRSILINPQYFI